MPAVPRDAATVILVRPAAQGAYEVLLTRRPRAMRFMGGMFVFPGGALDEHDCGPAIERLSALSPQEARERLGEDLPPERALGLYCCAVRELFEEVGVLLARDRSGGPVDPDRVREDYAQRRLRYGFAADAEAFARFLQAEGLVLATDLLVWHGRLITPEASPIRFDARFFVAPLPEGQAVVPDPGEVEEVLWLSPAEALRGAGELRLQVPIPTMSVLQGLVEVPAYAQVLGGARVTKDIACAPLSPLVLHLQAPNPGLMTGSGTNTYLVGEGETVIIDPGVADGAFVKAVAEQVSRRGRPAAILLTHLHPDHTGGAGVLAEQLGCPVGAFGGASDPLVTLPLRDGDTVRAGGATLRVLHTPGHASHHLCFFLEEERALFTGDVVAGAGTVVIAPPDGDMAQYLATLERLARLGVRRIYPGHGPVVEDGPGKIAEYIAHRRDRERQVIEALVAGLRRIPEMVERIYTDVPRALHPVAELSVRAHLEMLEREGRVRRREGDQWELARGA